MSMVEHARRELALLGEDRELSANLTATVAAYFAFGHSGGSHECTLELLVRLLRGEALTPLTVDPAEWEDRSEMSSTPLWQNVRDSRAMSSDGGRTYTLVDDQLQVTHKAELPPWWIDDLADRGFSPRRAKEAIHAYLEKGPIGPADRKALDELDDPGRVSYMVKRWGSEGVALAQMLYSPPAVFVGVDG